MALSLDVGNTQLERLLLLSYRSIPPSERSTLHLSTSLYAFKSVENMQLNPKRMLLKMRTDVVIEQVAAGNGGVVSHSTVDFLLRPSARRIEDYQSYITSKRSVFLSFPSSYTVDRQTYHPIAHIHHGRAQLQVQRHHDLRRLLRRSGARSQEVGRCVSPLSPSPMISHFSPLDARTKTPLC